MGILVVVIMTAAFFVAAAIYRRAKTAWHLPLFLNLPGAWFAFNVIPSLSGWLLHDLLEGYAHMPVPDVPWYTWLGYLGLTLFWYFPLRLSVESLVVKWRKGNVVAPEANQ